MEKLTDSVFALLIAPKGIEIVCETCRAWRQKTFNRTKRNWNKSIFSIQKPITISFNRTKRNWNDKDPAASEKKRYLLIAPKGIEMRSSHNGITLFFSFNRTKRNWNDNVQVDTARLVAFNRTKRNWNITKSLGFAYIIPFF